MKKFLFGLSLLAGYLTPAIAQNTNKAPKLSAYTQQYLLAAKNSDGSAPAVPGYVYKRIANTPCISALIKVNNTIDEGALMALGIHTGTKAGSVWTVQVPLPAVAAFTRLAGISYIELDAPMYPLMDSARRVTHADSAQKGIGLPATVTGRNVVSGIIDAGFDYNHPSMFDTAHSLYRIQKVWAQKGTGTPPTGFVYGHELTDSFAIKAAGYDTAIMSHGTHVTGIAAGSGYNSAPAKNGRFRGMAYESDIVLVGIMPDPAQWIAAGASDIVDGLNYIFTYAASTGQPAVVNLSWGSTLGPHDGSSLFGEACDALTGPGRIFVCAAGNNGQDTVHLKKAFTPTDTAVSTFVTFSPYLDTSHLGTWVDVWGDSSNTFCLNVRLYNGPIAIDSTGPVCLSDTTRTFALIGSDGDTCHIIITTTPDDYNGRPHAFVTIRSKVPDNICLTTTATAGTVNMWEGYVLPPSGYYGAFKKLGYPWAVSGDANMTVSDIGCTRSAVTVGAYTSKASFVNISGASLGYSGAVRGRIAPFSSFGPSSDGRTKPDITAPGFAVAASISSFDTTYGPTGPNYNGVITADTDGTSGRIYRSAVLAGTSMAAPCVAGIIAMMLQINPTLSPTEVKDIITATAIKDVYTGAIPLAGTNTWGHGKINAYGAINRLAAMVSVQHEHMDPVNCLLFPNPGNGTFTISYTGTVAEELTITIADAAGRHIATRHWPVTKGTSTRRYDDLNLPKGLYFVKTATRTGYNVVKMTVL